MSDEAPFAVVVEEKRRWPVKWLALGALIVLFAVWKAWDLYAPITISPQTTYITEPLTADGLPDFEAYILAETSRGVTPENNAAVLLWQALGPGELDPFDQQAVAEAIGVPADPAGVTPLSEEHLQDRLQDWLAREEPDRREEYWEAADDLYEAYSQRPWKSEQIPPLAAWLDENHSAIELIVAATDRPRFFAPPPELLNDYPDSLLTLRLDAVQSSRAAARALLARSLNHTGEGRLDAAWRDTLAALRLSRLVGQGWTIIDQLVAIAIQGTSRPQFAAILSSPSLTPELARQILSDLQSLPRLPRLVEVCDRAERLAAIDFTLNLATGRATTEELGKGLPRGRVNADIILREVNQVYDDLVAAARTPGRLARSQALAEWDAAMEARFDETVTPLRLVGGFLSKRARSRTIGEIVLSVMLPAISAVFDAQDRADAEFDLLLVAAALAVHRAEHGEYPDSLDALAPDILPSVPADLYSGQPLIYHRKPDGYLLYSVFKNGVDDGGDDWGGEIIDGEWFDPNAEPDDADEDAELEWQREPINLDNSDSVIRIPVPAFVLPLGAKGP